MRGDQPKRKSWTRLSFQHHETTAELLARDQATSQRVYRVGVTVVFAAAVSALICLGRQGEPGFNPGGAVGIVVLAHIALLLLVRSYHREVLAGARTFTQLFFLVGIFLFLSWGLLFSGTLSPYLLPLPVLAMLLALIYSSMLAIHVSFGVAVLLALMYVPPAGEEQVLMTRITMVFSLFLGSLVGIMGVQRIRTRTRLVIVGLASGVIQFLAIAVLGLWMKEWQNPAVMNLDELKRIGADLVRYFAQPGLGFLNGLASGILMTSALPFIEDLFEVITDMRLIELSDQNKPLLHQFSLLAPGSWEHSRMVAQLAEQAAVSIGANDLLARVGAYYHDIGKMKKPNYFTENMRGDDNPHDKISPEMSRLIIISHVRDGVAILEEEGLPRPIIDMVPMHHGTTVVEYFYNKRRLQDFEKQEKTERVAFQYPGPRPTFPEAGILMLADSTEAIARTLTDPTPTRLRNVVANVIRKRMTEGQLEECDLTLRDLRLIEDAFVRVLVAIYHHRIRYQDDDNGAPVPATKSNESMRGVEAAPRRAAGETERRAPSVASSREEKIPERVGAAAAARTIPPAAKGRV